jgi:hypothetical protein
VTNAPDPQDQAEQIDEDVIGGDDSAVTADQVAEYFPPDELHGVPFADADVTDESFAERTAQELPEVSERDVDERDA